MKIREMHLSNRIAPDEQFFTDLQARLNIACPECLNRYLRVSCGIHSHLVVIAPCQDVVTDFHDKVEVTLACSLLGQIISLYR